MGAFEPVTLVWEGAEYAIPPRRILMAIAQIEEVLTLDELTKFNRRGTAPVAKLSMAYGAVLRYAGCSVTDEEVYAGMFADAGASATVATQGLMQMMLPPAAMVMKGGTSGKRQAGGNQGKRSSKNSSKPHVPNAG